MSYKPQLGDRVRVIVEGEVTCIGPSGFDIGGASGVYVSYDMPGASVEKLAVPEPVWVQGARIEIDGILTPIVHVDGDWFYSEGGRVSPYYHHSAPERISHAWQNGDLKIIWNGDE